MELCAMYNKVHSQKKTSMHLISCACLHIIKLQMLFQLYYHIATAYFLSHKIFTVLYIIISSCSALDIHTQQIEIAIGNKYN